MMGPDDRGSATIWTVAAAMLLIALAVTVTARSAAVAARHQVERAADFTALAAAGEIGRSVQPCRGIDRIARANRAVLQSCVATLDPSGRSGTVSVAVSVTVALPLIGQRHVTGRSRAGRSPPAPGAAP